MTQIIIVTVEGSQIDCQVRGSSLSVKQYGDVVALIIRNIAGLFASSGAVTESQVVEEIIRVVDDEGRKPVATHTETLQ